MFCNWPDCLEETKQELVFFASVCRRIFLEILPLQSTVLRNPRSFLPFPFLLACNERILIRALGRQRVVVYEVCHRNNAALEGGPRLGEVNYIAC